MTFVPDLQTLTNGTVEAVCGRCLGRSPSITAVDAATAWDRCVALGWSLYQHRPGSRRYAVCPECSAHPETIDEAVAKARKSRKRK